MIKRCKKIINKAEKNIEKNKLIEASYEFLNAIYCLHRARDKGNVFYYGERLIDLLEKIISDDIITFSYSELDTEINYFIFLIGFRLKEFQKAIVFISQIIKLYNNIVLRENQIEPQFKWFIKGYLTQFKQLIVFYLLALRKTNEAEKYCNEIISTSKIEISNQMKKNFYDFDKFDQLLQYLLRKDFDNALKIFEKSLTRYFKYYKPEFKDIIAIICES